MFKKVAILTSGGDSPGMNNVIYSAIQTAKSNNIDVELVFNGYRGLIDKEIVNQKDVNVKYATLRGGSVIKTARFLDFKKPEVREQAVKNLQDLGIEALIVIGGDGSFAGAQKLHELGIKTVGIPGTIDNDIASTDYTIGFDTALHTIVDSIDKIRDTMSSMRRVCLVEVMGHGAGDLAMWSGIATGAEIIVTNKTRITVDEMANQIDDLYFNKKKDSIIAVISEGIYSDMNELAKTISGKLQNKITVRAAVLGHIQRGGVPNAMDRVRAVEMGRRAIEFLIEGKSGVALGYKHNNIVATPIEDALKETSNPNDEINRVKAYNKINKA